MGSGDLPQYVKKGNHASYSKCAIETNGGLNTKHKVVAIQQIQCEYVMHLCHEQHHGIVQFSKFAPMMMGTQNKCLNAKRISMQ